MTDGATFAAWVGGLSAFAMFAFHVYLSVRGGAWSMSDRLGKMEGRIMAKIAEEREQAREQGDLRHLEIEKKIDEQEHFFGETARSLQQKIHELETWSRDEFVRRSDFEQATVRIETMVSRVDLKFDAMHRTLMAIATAVGSREATRIAEIP